MFDQLVGSKLGMYIVVGVAVIVVALVLWWFIERSRGGAGARGANLLNTVRNLRATNAQWPAIMAALNPSRDSKLAGLLQELRGPHMFVPHTALSIIEDACRANPHASIREILSNARGDMAKVTRYGD